MADLPEGFPLGYEVLPGNTRDKQTLGSALASIEKQYGKARRVWVMDRGIPTEETLEQMRHSDPPVHYLVGTGPGADTASSAGEICRSADDRRSFADDRWPSRDPAAPHSTGKGTAGVAGSDEADVARATTTQDHVSRPTDRMSLVVQTF